MADKKTQLAADFTDDAIRRFLLGRLNAGEQSTFEELLFADDRLEGRVRLAEFDVADDYAMARLSLEDREAFEQKFLLSAERKQTLNVSTALRDRFASASTMSSGVDANAPFGGRLRHLFGFEQRAWRLGFAVVIVVVLLGAAWFVLKRPRIPERFRVGIFNRRPPAPAPAPAPSVPRMTAHPGDTSSAPEHPVTPSPMLPHEPTESPAIVSVALSPDASRDSDKIPVRNLPQGEHDIVRLQLPLKSNQTGVYRAELLSSDSQSIFAAQSLQSTDSGAGKIDFDVPAALLKTGVYQVRLSRVDDRSKRTVAGYYFRVQ